jgi:hypothetical protein
MLPVGFEPVVPASGGSQLPLDLRRESAAARLLEMRVRIPPGAWMSVSYECCVLSGRGLCVGLITRPESRTECGVSECDHEASIIRKFWPTRGCCTMKKKIPASERPQIHPFNSAATGFGLSCIVRVE